MADEHPITPHAGPLRDPSGLLSYIGDDGRRYVVGTPNEADPSRTSMAAAADAEPDPSLAETLVPDPHSADRVMRDLRQATSLYRRIESLCRDWISAVQSPDLDRSSALVLLLTTLETTLEDPDGDADPPV